MRHGISLVAFGHATSLFLAITFVLCVAFDLLLPGHAMYPAWQKLLPGFEWISWKSFVLGLVESYGYGWYATLIRVPLYNVFAAKIGRPPSPLSGHVDAFRFQNKLCARAGRPVLPMRTDLAVASRRVNLQAARPGRSSSRAYLCSSFGRFTYIFFRSPIESVPVSRRRKCSS